MDSITSNHPGFQSALSALAGFYTKENLEELRKSITEALTHKTESAQFEALVKLIDNAPSEVRQIPKQQALVAIVQSILAGYSINVWTAKLVIGTPKQSWSPSAQAANLSMLADMIKNHSGDKKSFTEAIARFQVPPLVWVGGSNFRRPSGEVVTRTLR